MFEGNRAEEKMKAYTDITVLVDRSGSMGSIKDAMESAFNEFLKGHQEVPSTRISLIQFDTVDPQEIVYQGVPVKYADPLVLNPRGGTPLLDAMCEAIDRTGSRLSNIPEDVRPDQVLMVVITDGQENASRKRSRQDVFNRVTTQRNNYNWQFIYLGANQDAIGEAATFGIPKEWSMNYNSTARSVASASAGLMANTVAYTKQADRGVAVLDWSDAQRAEAENE